MIFRRLALPSNPSGGFMYALAFKNANYIQIGIGFESLNGLQMTHVKSADLHHSCAVEQITESMTQGNTALLTGKLAPFFDGMNALHLNADACQVLLRMVAEVRDEAFGHPMDWEPEFIELLDGRFIWITYGQDIDKIRIGMGFYDESNTPRYGAEAYAVGVNNVADFAVENFIAARMPESPLAFMGRPVGFPPQMSGHIFGDHRQCLAVLLIKLADKCWPGRVKLSAAAND